MSRFVCSVVLFLVAAAPVWSAPAGTAEPAAPADAQAQGAETQEPAAPTAEPCAECRPEAWQTQLSSVRDQLNLLGLLARATGLGGATVRIPREIQRIPLEMMEGTEELTKRNIELYLKEVRFLNLRLDREETPLWQDQRPLLPGLATFDRLGVTLDAKTRMGTFPVQCELRQGALPFQFHCKQEGYDVGIAPPYRRDEAKIEDVKLDFGGPVASGILTKIFGRKVAGLVIEAAAGKTFQLGEKDLLGGTGLPLGDIAPVGETVGTILDALGK